jgi:hypothetical protein
MAFVVDVERGDVARNGDGQLPIEVGEELSAARRLPAEAGAKGIGIHRDEHEGALAGVVPPASKTSELVRAAQAHSPRREGPSLGPYAPS